MKQTNPDGKVVHLAELLPVIQDVLEQNGSVVLTITGTSMYPTMLGGRDQVVLEKPDRALKRGDLPLYRRKNGQFILHRIVAVEPDGSYTCCGDHQWALEKGIREEQILALVTRFCRNGKWRSVTGRGYRLWVRFWTMILPARKSIFRLAGAVSGIKKKIRS